MPWHGLPRFSSQAARDNNCTSGAGKISSRSYFFLLPAGSRARFGCPWGEGKAGDPEPPAGQLFMRMRVDSFDLVIIGAGISGLSLAHFCARQGLNTCLMEKNGRPGGAIHTERFDEGFWLEMGTHTCYNSYGRLLGIIEECELTERLIKREKVPWLFWEKGRTKPIASRLHFLELLFSLPRLLTVKKAGLSVEDYFGRIMGKRNFHDVVGPMVGAVTSQDAASFPAEMLFKKRPRQKGIPRSFTIQGGLQTLPEAIVADERLTFMPDAEVRQVEFEREKFRLTIASGDTVEAGALALATSPPVAAELLGGSFARAAAPLSRIGMKVVDSVGVVVRGADTTLPPMAGLVPLGESIRSVVTRDTVSHPTYRGFVFHFQAGEEEEEKNWRIATLLGVPRSMWLHEIAKNNVIPALEVGHAKLIEELDSSLSGQRLLATGNYFTGLALEDCVARSAQEAERLKALG